jgi:hypothetical protein
MLTNADAARNFWSDFFGSRSQVTLPELQAVLQTHHGAFIGAGSDASEQRRIMNARSLLSLRTLRQIVLQLTPVAVGPIFM